MSFDEDLDAQVTRELDWIDVDVLVNGKLHTLRFTEMGGLEWANVCDQAPPRPTVKVDVGFGYNIRLVAELAAPVCGTLREGDGWVPLDPKQWAKFFKGAAGSSYKSIGDALFTLNQWGPQQAVSDAKKASAVESRTSSDLPAPSEFPVPVS